MLDIVVYGSKNFIQKNIDSIDLSAGEINHNIYTYNTYNNQLDCLIKSREIKKIYILEDEVSSISGLEVAIKIRKYDWDSIIIFIIDSCKQVSDVYNMKLMFLDIIINNSSCSNRMISDLKLAISIINKKNLFIFKYNHIVYRIPYNQIDYIEKESGIKRCIIHTVNKNYYITGTINSILSKLNDNFCRTHQSCIVNLNNVKEIDFSSNIIKFNNGDRIDMLTSKMKKVIKEYYDIY